MTVILTTQNIGGISAQFLHQLCGDLEKKNMYLRRQDYNHPSFNVYVETVNQVFNKYFD